MAETKAGVKAGATPPENKTAEPVKSDSMSAADRKRQQELSQSGYRLPDSFFVGEKERIARDKAVAENQTKSRKAED